jgi:hypothetical protein
VRPRRRLETAEQEALKAAIRKAFEAEEAKRDAEFKEQCSRLLSHLDQFEKGSDDA